MRVVIGIVSLLLALAIVALLASQQMKTVGRLPVPTEASGASAAAPGGTVREQSQQLEDKVRNDVTRALEQGAARNADADK